MAIGKMVSLAVAGPGRLELEWDDGHGAAVDLGAVIAGHPGLKPIRAARAFAKAALSDDGWSVEWPGGVDFGAYARDTVAALSELVQRPSLPSTVCNAHDKRDMRMRRACVRACACGWVRMAFMISSCAPALTSSTLLSSTHTHNDH
jgi:hypothetical protein